MRKILCLILLITPLLMLAQDMDTLSVDLEYYTTAQIDSIFQAREQEVVSDYGFKTTDTLLQVFEKLEMEDNKLGKWKAAMGLEAENESLNSMSLSFLGITPYKAYLAHQTALHNFDETSTLAQISRTFSIPIKKLKNLMGFKVKNQEHHSIQLLGKSVEEVIEVIDDYQETVHNYGWAVTLVGMLVVFSALIITSIVISQLIYLNREKKPKKDSSKPVAASDAKPKEMAADTATDPDRDSMIAAITALHLYKTDLEERRKLALTFRRTPTNQWRASAVLSMPNREMNSYRRK